MDKGFSTEHDDDVVRISARPTVLIMDISDEEAVLWDELAGLSREELK